MVKASASRAEDPGFLLLLQRSTAVQVRSSVRLMPQNQPSCRGLLPSPTAWSIPGLNPACPGSFSGSSHTSDLKISAPVATLPGAWCYRASAGTGCPCVSILWLGEMESLVCNLYLSVAAREIEQTRPWDTLACCWDVKQPTNNNTSSGDKQSVSFSMVGDDVFGHKPWLMKPHPCRFVTSTGSNDSAATERRRQRIFDYRLSRARRIFENVLGIPAARFWVFCSVVKLSSEKANTVTFCCLALHDFFMGQGDLV